MTNLNKKNLPLPKQISGIQKDIQATRGFPGIQQARSFYSTAKSRLLDVNGWEALCGVASATFELTDNKGQRVNHDPQVGFYFKIDVPGPGATSGKGFDWVQVEAVNENSDEASDMDYIHIKVRPASDPTTPNENTAHFFSEKSTSNFLILREGREVTAAVLGRNEAANTAKDDKFIDKLRNFLIGTGAKLGMANPQWKSLVKGILE